MNIFGIARKCPKLHIHYGGHTDWIRRVLRFTVSKSVCELFFLFFLFCVCTRFYTPKPLVNLAPSVTLAVLTFTLLVERKMHEGI